MRFFSALFISLVVSGPGSASAIAQSPRPAERPEVTRVASAAILATSIRPQQRRLAPVIPAAGNARFDNWVEAFKRRATRQGITPRTLNTAFADIRYLPQVVKLDRNQSEFTKTLWDYLDSAVSATRVNNGRAALRKHARALDAIEARYGVEKEVVVAIWGLESAYGTFKGGTPALSALATLAYDGRRAEFFEAELLKALRIIQSGDTTPANMEGSWAGAMGHTQFMPSSYLAYAQDFNGDGRRDIWGDDPTDALASTANYLKQFGWTKGQPWGMEVTLPRGFDYAQTGERIKKSANAWTRLGVRTVAGGTLPSNGDISILVPAGSQGAAFAIYKNFSVIERYNPADAYVIGVGHLSDRIAGRPAIQASWPRGDRALKLAERKELQRRLARAGFDPGGVDGKIGPNTLQAVRGYQASQGLTPDGYASLAVLQRLRR